MFWCRWRDTIATQKQVYLIGAVHQYKSNIIWRNTCDNRFWEKQLIRGLFDNCFLVGRLPILRCQRDLKIRHGSWFWSTQTQTTMCMLCLNVQVFASYCWGEQRFPQKSLSRAYIKSLEERLACCICCIQAYTSGNSPPQTWSQEERGLLSKCVSIWLIITFSEKQSNLKCLRHSIPLFHCFNELIPH